MSYISFSFITVIWVLTNSPVPSHICSETWNEWDLCMFPPRFPSFHLCFLFINFFPSFSRLANNQFTGKIPESLGDLFELEHLYVFIPSHISMSLTCEWLTNRSRSILNKKTVICQTTHSPVQTLKSVETIQDYAEFVWTGSLNAHLNPTRSCQGLRDEKSLKNIWNNK